MKTLYAENLSEYRSWQSMKQRCFNPNNTSFARYGGSGITVCEQWKNSFETFLKDMESKPKTGWHIHRTDTEGNYEPDNCIWIEPKIHHRIPHRPHIHSKKSLTQKQGEVLDFIADQALSPSIREIASHFNITVKGAYDHVKALKRKGKITTQSNKARSIAVIPEIQPTSTP